MRKNFDDAYELLETMVANNYQWPFARMNQPRVVEIYELDVVTALAAQVAILTKKIDTLGAQPIQNVSIVCELCAENHLSSQYAISSELVQYIG